MSSWLQPQSYIDPLHTVILHSADDNAGLSCNVPVTLTVLTRDQYAELAAVPHLTVSLTELLLISFMYNVMMSVCLCVMQLDDSDRRALCVLL